MGHALTKERLAYLARAAMLREAAALLVPSPEKETLLAEAAACDRMAVSDLSSQWPTAVAVDSGRVRSRGKDPGAPSGFASED